MAWKLKKGKFRPRLQQFVDGADPDVVVAVTTTALKAAKAGNLRQAIDALTDLKGVRFSPHATRYQLQCFSGSIQ